MDDILTVQEVADYLRVSRTSIWRWCQEGRIRAFKLGRTWRIQRSEVQRLVASSSDTTDGRAPAPSSR